MCDVWHIFFVHKRIATGYIDRVSSMRASSWCVPDNFSSRKLCRPLKQPSRFCTKIPRTKILSDQCYCSEIILLQLRRIHCQQLVTLFVDYSANGVNWIFKIHNFFSTFGRQYRCLLRSSFLFQGRLRLHGRFRSEWSNEPDRWLRI